MPIISATQYTAIQGFAITGNGDKGSIDEGETFFLADEINRFGAGRKMVNVYDTNGNIIGYVTTGQAELIRSGDC